MAELDALEVYYPAGIAGFLEDAFSKDPDSYNSDSEAWLMDPGKRMIPGA